jgi:hypothetical protein
MPDHSLNGWTEYQRLVMSSLEQHEKKLESIYEALTSIKVEIGMLKVKAGIWGIVGGALPIAFSLLLKKGFGIE